ncbi:inovirus Gp2 family protein [Escherichia coli]|nr:inovirus Gp2 family protein [Escherichia coli]EHY3820951.1 inovirus Gp2 family protein [Escherichia coli]HAX6976415.1 inovirus Gp2 family protein [Escherichia coli]HCN4735253.1 inovirus Gp2 family protein [Escherichia coli]HCO7866930.1 inovirus Gp2 family protein [Escherichia coli]
MRNQVNNLFQKHPRITAIRVDLHYPPVIDNGDTITCFPNLSPGEISRFRNSLNAKINADQHRKKQQGKRTYATSVCIIWAKEYTQSFKCHYHVCLFFNKDAYYHLGDYERSDTLRGLITGAWYSALGLELEDHQGLVHFPANGRYILDINDPDFPEQYQRLLARLDYLTKLDTKASGQRNFGYSGF